MSARESKSTIIGMKLEPTFQKIRRITRYFKSRTMVIEDENVVLLTRKLESCYCQQLGRKAQRLLFPLSLLPSFILSFLFRLTFPPFVCPIAISVLFYLLPVFLGQPLPFQVLSTSSPAFFLLLKSQASTHGSKLETSLSLSRDIPRPLEFTSRATRVGRIQNMSHKTRFRVANIKIRCSCSSNNPFVWSRNLDCEGW
jgi:hypothetical protein